MNKKVTSPPIIERKSNTKSNLFTFEAHTSFFAINKISVYKIEIAAAKKVI